MAHGRRTEAGRNENHIAVQFQQTIPRGTGRNPKIRQDPENRIKKRWENTRGTGRKEGTQSNETN